MLRAARNVGKTKFDLIVGTSAIRTDHSKVLFDYMHEVDLPPTNHATDLWIRSCFNNPCQFLHLFVIDQPGSSCPFFVGQAIRPLLIETVHPIRQCLTVITALACKTT